MATAASGAGEPAPQQMFSWEELKSYVGEVLAMYGSADREYRALSGSAGGLASLKADIRALAAAMEADSRKLIADMQSRVSRVESESSACAPPIAETRAALAALEEQKARLVEDVQRLRRGKEVGQAALHALTQQIAAIKQAKATLNSDHGSNVPRVRHSLSLYASISSIRWDYDSDAVAGYVAPPHGAPVKPFHLDPRALSEKAIADALWASIGEAYGLPEARA